MKAKHKLPDWYPKYEEKLSRKIDGYDLDTQEKILEYFELLHALAYQFEQFHKEEQKEKNHER